MNYKNVAYLNVELFKLIYIFCFTSKLEPM